MKYHNPLTTLCSIAGCIALVCVVFVGARFINQEEEIPHEYVSTEINSNGSIIYTSYLGYDSVSKNKIKQLISDSDCIAILSNLVPNNVNYEIKSGRFYLNTEGTGVIDKIFYGNVYLTNSVIKYSKYCGIISLKDLEQDTTVDWEEWEVSYIGHEIPEDEKENTYFRQLPSKGYEFEEGKQYLVFLKYDKEEDIYNVWDFAYGIMEYDPTTNMVKNIDTGEFEEFDWTLIQNK